MNRAPTAPRPLPRRMRNADRAHMAEYLQDAVDGAVVVWLLPSTLESGLASNRPMDLVVRSCALLRALAEDAGVTEAAMLRAYEGRGGLGPDALWRVGESLRRFGVPWSSGLCALSHVPSYRGHALCVAYAMLLSLLLAADPSRNGHSFGLDAWKDLWPALAFVLVQADVQFCGLEESLADVPGACEALDLDRWLAARRMVRLRARDALKSFNDPRYALPVADAWLDHRRREGWTFADAVLLGFDLFEVDEMMHADLIDRLAPIADAIEFERIAASLQERARAQDAVDDLVESLS
jgi:hypothetical protein